MSEITPIKLSNAAIPVKEVLTGEELLYILDNNTSKKATTQAVANMITTDFTGGGLAYLLTLSTAPTYNPDGSLKILKQAYVSDPTKYFEQRFEYTAGLVSKIEIKDDIAEKWVRQTNIYDANGQLQVPTITDIIEWTII